MWILERLSADWRTGSIAPPAFEISGQAKLQHVGVSSCIIKQSRERGNATVSPHSCLHSGPRRIKQNVAAGKLGVLR
uniref:Uncharacterized protein n=1 Tax=Anabas testudineus TaxID=64144 RepID=A0A3Q1JN41_ANATE